MRDPGDASSARRYYSAAAALAQELELRPLEAQSHLGLGELAQRLGQREQGQVALDKAAQLFQEMGMQFWLEKAQATAANMR